jgi:hypothetical protein
MGLHQAVRDYLDKKRDDKHEKEKKAYERRYMEMLLMEDEAKEEE